MALKILLLFFTIVCQICNSFASANEPFGVNVMICYGSDNKPMNPNYKSNVYTLLSILVSESSSHSPPLTFFKTSSVGEVLPKAYGSYLCRGDLSAKICHNCLEYLENYLIETNTIMGYDCIIPDRNQRCMIHYANNSKSLDFTEKNAFTGGNYGDDSLTKDSPYNTTLSDSVKDLITEARYGNWSKVNFATKVAEVSVTDEKIYILAQCTTDMPPVNCSNCLTNLIGTWGIGQTPRGFILGENCLLKYDDQSFFGNACLSSMPSYLQVILLFLFTLYFTVV